MLAAAPPQSWQEVIDRISVRLSSSLEAAKRPDQVARARKGRRLTRNMQAKVLDAWRRVSGEKEATLAQLFNYPGC